MVRVQAAILQPEFAMPSTWRASNRGSVSRGKIFGCSARPTTNVWSHSASSKGCDADATTSPSKTCEQAPRACSLKEQSRPGRGENELPKHQTAPRNMTVIVSPRFSFFLIKSMPCRIASNFINVTFSLPTSFMPEMRDLQATFLFIVMQPGNDYRFDSASLLSDFSYLSHLTSIYRRHFQWL